LNFMGRRGPAPTPTAILNARGSPRAGRNKAEPKPESGLPARPAGLSPAAAEVWDAMSLIVAPGVLTRDNGQALARYCHGLLRWWKLAVWLDTNEDTYTVKDQQGNIRHVRHPNVITYEKLGRDLMRMEQEFGLTPAARTRVQTVAPPAKPKDDRTRRRFSESRSDIGGLEGTARIGASQVPGYNPWDQAGDSWLDHEAALAAINWFAENLKHVEGSPRANRSFSAWQARDRRQPVRVEAEAMTPGGSSAGTGSR
jgi:P27 family predicted phage terminase small subunit